MPALELKLGLSPCSHSKALSIEPLGGLVAQATTEWDAVDSVFESLAENLSSLVV